MPTPDLTPDEITDRIADEVAGRVLASHPHASPAFQELLVRLYTAQAVGDAPPPGVIRDRTLGAYLGMDARRISETRARGLARAWQAYHKTED